VTLNNSDRMAQTTSI